MTERGVWRVHCHQNAVMVTKSTAYVPPLSCTLTYPKLQVQLVSLVFDGHHFVPPSLQSGCKPLLDTQVHFVASLDEALVKDYRYKQVPYLPVSCM